MCERIQRLEAHVAAIDQSLAECVSDVIDIINLEILHPYNWRGILYVLYIEVQLNRMDNYNCIPR